MNRKNFISTIYNQVNALATMGFTPKELLKLVTAFKIANNIIGWSTLEAVVTDGFLTINDIPLERIASRTPRKVFTDYGYHMEGKCIH